MQSVSISVHRSWSRGRDPYLALGKRETARSWDDPHVTTSPEAVIMHLRPELRLLGSHPKCFTQNSPLNARGVCPSRFLSKRIARCYARVVSLNARLVASDQCFVRRQCLVSLSLCRYAPPQYRLGHPATEKLKGDYHSPFIRIRSCGVGSDLVFDEVISFKGRPMSCSFQWLPPLARHAITVHYMLRSAHSSMACFRSPEDRGRTTFSVTVLPETESCPVIGRLLD